MARVGLIMSICIFLFAFLLVHGGLTSEARKLNMEKRNKCETMCVAENIRRNDIKGFEKGTNGGLNAPARRSRHAGADQLIAGNGVHVESTSPGHSPGVGHSVGPASNDPNP